MPTEKEIAEYIGTAKFIADAGLILSVKGKDEQHLLDIRGWGHIQNMFKEGGNIDEKAAGEFQDKVGDFIADAINEKMERESL